MGDPKKDMFIYSSGFPGILEEPCKGQFNHQDWSSQYMRVNQAVSCSLSVYIALRAYALITESSGNNAGIGKMRNGNCVAELLTDDLSCNMADVCVVTTRGLVYGGQADLNLHTITPYVVSSPERGGAIVLLAKMQELLADEEANDCYNTLLSGLLLNPLTETQTSFESITNIEIGIWAGSLAKISDNFYQRIAIGGSQSDVPLSFNTTGECKKLPQGKISNGDYAPRTNIVGMFRVLETQQPTTPQGVNVDTNSFVGSYMYGDQSPLTTDEQELIPVVDENWIIPPEAVKIANLIQVTSKELEPMRNFMLQGPAGTGKTKTSEIVAAGVTRPKVTLTCSADMEIFDFIGQNQPVVAKETTNLPSAYDIAFDLKGSYQRLTGEVDIPEGFDETDCLELLIKKTKEQSNNTSGFHYVETPLIKALKYGWICEIQEPTVIIRPGVLVGLNSLLEPKGVITLPTGEVIQRHPDAVVIITTNLNYKGCDGLNQSVLSRMDMIISMETPARDILVDRTLSRTGFAERSIVDSMAEIITDIAEYLQQNDIDDGTCGVRELISWVKAVKAEGNGSIYDNAIHCVVEKATTNKIEQESIKTSFLDTSSFAL